MVDFGICPAFPNGIPLNILRGEDLHLGPVKDQKNGFIFTLKVDSI